MKNYTFMLVLPRSVIQDKIDHVNRRVIANLRDVFIIPFVTFSICIMIVTSCCLIRISASITSPIVELYEKIKLIIDFH